MLKWIVLFIVFACAIAASFGGYLYVNRAPFLSALLTHALLVPVKIERIDISRSGGTLHHVSIGNPAGCAQRNALEADRVDVALSWYDFITTPYAIDEVHIVSPTLALELFSATGSDNNWTRLVAAIPSSSEGVIIQKLLLTDITVGLQSHSLAGNLLVAAHKLFQPRTIKSIQINDVGDGGTLSTPQVVAVVVRGLLSQIASSLNLPVRIYEAL